jgi:hypothetical protein
VVPFSGKELFLRMRSEVAILATCDLPPYMRELSEGTKRNVAGMCVKRQEKN